jgi:anaphase-promoting complex subunit 6
MFAFYITEYSLTNNQNFAERFFNQALDIAPHDPFVLHELGVTAYNSQVGERLIVH